MENITNKIMLVVLIGLLFGGYTWYIYDKGEAQEKLVWDADTLKKTQAADKLQKDQQAAADEAARQAAEALDRLNKQNADLQEKLENEIAKNNVYRTCRVPAAGILLYNEAARSN